MSQPKALYFAEMLEVSDKRPELINVNNRAAVELRRLHEVNAELVMALKGLHDDVMDYIQLNGLGGEDNHWLVIARAVIAKATAIAEPSS